MLTLLIAGIPAYLLLALVAYHIEKRLVDSDAPALFAIGWPIRLGLLAFLAALLLPLGAVYGAGWLANEGIGRLFGKTDGLVDRLLTMERPKWLPPRRPGKHPGQTELKPAPPPQISIPQGAILGSEEYRRLKPMVEEYEAKLPVHERE